MRDGGPKAIPVGGPPGPSAVTRASALQDVVDAIKAVLTAPDLASARADLGLGNVANLAPADLPVSTATSTAIASLAALVSANQAALNTILAGANPAIDTFIEAYNRFLADEGAAAAMLASISALQTALGNEAARAQGAEGTNATNIANNVTAIASEASRAQGVEATLALKARQVIGAGLAVGGGDLTADRAITVPKAVQADVAAGTDDAKALTSFAVAARFGLTAPLASPALTGTPTAPTAAAGTATAQIATTGFVGMALGPYQTASAAASTYAPLASPALTGTPTAPTAAVDAATTQIATTAFVLGQSAAATPAMDGAAAVGASTRYARADHVHPSDTSRVPTARQVVAGTGLSGGGVLSGDVTVALAAIPTLTLLANTGGSAAVPAGVTLSALLDAALGPTRGALAYRGASGWAVLAPGSSGQVLTSNGAGADPGYAAVAAAASYPNVFEVNGLAIRPGATVASQISVAVNAILLKGASAGLPLGAASATITTGTVGANGLDTGTLAPTAWYAIHAIAKADGTFAGLLSASATAPTLPSGYAYSARIGWALTDASKNLVPIVQTGRQARYKVTGSRAYPTVVSGAVGDVSAPTWVSVAISGFAPTTAAGGLFSTYATSGSSTVAVLAPNGSYGNYAQGESSSASPPPVNSTITGAGPAPMHFETTNVYAACQANAGIVCLGWEDNL